MGSGCKKKAPAPAPQPKASIEPTTPDAPAAASPVITLGISPSAIEKGQAATLSWNSTNATGVTIDNGVGTVEPSGSREIRPSESTTYLARATGPGGTSVAEARVTVTAPSAVTPPPLSSISDSEFFSANIKDAFFDYDQYSIREDARANLQAAARALNSVPPFALRLRGIATNAVQKSTTSRWEIEGPVRPRIFLLARESIPAG